MAITGALGRGGTFLVAGGLVYEIIAFACSSPQTAEINIHTRGDTLMKWVHLGQGLAAVTIIIAAALDATYRGAIIGGGVFAMASAEAFYLYAKQSGLAKPGPATEQHYSSWG